MMALLSTGADATPAAIKCTVNPNHGTTLHFLMAGYELPQAMALHRAATKNEKPDADPVKSPEGLAPALEYAAKGLNCAGLCSLGASRAKKWAVTVFDKPGTCDPARQAPALFVEALKAWRGEACRQRRLCRCEATPDAKGDAKKKCKALATISCGDDECPASNPPPPAGRADWTAAYKALRATWSELMDTPPVGKCVRGLATWYLKRAPRGDVKGCELAGPAK